MGVDHFHAWLCRAPSHRERSDAEILVNMPASFMESSSTYGARRIWRDVLAAGILCSLYKIERLKRSKPIRAELVSQA